MRGLQPLLPGLPVESCITMVQVATGKPKESWEQRTAGRTYAQPGQE